MIYISNLGFTTSNHRISPIFLVALITAIGVVDIRVAMYLLHAALKTVTAH